MRRAANRSGVYARFEFTFPASLLKPGENTVSLQMASRRVANNSGPADANLPTGQMPGSTANNGIMYDTIVLEAD